MIYPRGTKISNREPKQAPKTYDSQTNFQWTNNKIPCSFCTFETTKENIVWSMAIGKNILPLIKGKQTALMSWNSLLWLLLQSSWSFSSENGVKWIVFSFSARNVRSLLHKVKTEKKSRSVEKQACFKLQRRGIGEKCGFFATRWLSPKVNKVTDLF